MILVILKKQKSNQVTLLKISNAGGWELEVNKNQCFEVELYGECIITNFLIWLNFSGRNEDGKVCKFHLLLLTDSANKDLLRQLRVRLRFSLNNDKSENPLQL